MEKHIVKIFPFVLRVYSVMYRKIVLICLAVVAMAAKAQMTGQEWQARHDRFGDVIQKIRILPA